MASIVNDPNGRKRILFVAPTAKGGRPARAFVLCQHVNETPGGQAPCQRNPENP